MRCVAITSDGRILHSAYSSHGIGSHLCVKLSAEDLSCQYLGGSKSQFVTWLGSCVATPQASDRAPSSYLRGWKRIFLSRVIPERAVVSTRWDNMSIWFLRLWPHSWFFLRSEFELLSEGLDGMTFLRISSRSAVLWDPHDRSKFSAASKCSNSLFKSTGTG